MLILVRGICHFLFIRCYCNYTSFSRIFCATYRINWVILSIAKPSTVEKSNNKMPFSENPIINWRWDFGSGCCLCCMRSISLNVYRKAFSLLPLSLCRRLCQCHRFSFDVFHVFFFYSRRLCLFWYPSGLLYVVLSASHRFSSPLDSTVLFPVEQMRSHI